MNMPTARAVFETVFLPRRPPLPSQGAKTHHNSPAARKYCRAASAWSSGTAMRRITAPMLPSTAAMFSS